MDNVETSGGRNTHRQAGDENIMGYINKLEDLLRAFVDQAADVNLVPICNVARANCVPLYVSVACTRAVQI